MNINCVICSDIFEPSSEVYITQCGHMFHYTCLLSWIERSKTCPQCRNRCTEKNIQRVYFNLSNTDHIVEDAVSLQSKLDNLKFQLSLKEKDIKNFRDKYAKSKNSNINLREEIKQLEAKTKVSESAIHALKEQISFFKNKSRETERLSDEISRLKNRLKDSDNVQIAINGTREEVNNMLRNENNIEAVALLAATLKKSLVDTERKKREMEHRLKIAQIDATKYKREANSFECQYNEMKQELEHLKTNWSKEKQYLKNKILELSKRSVKDTDTDTETSTEMVDSSIQRIVDESPINFNRKVTLNKSNLIDLSYLSSPCVSDKVKEIMDSDSPYLPVKSSSVGIDNFSLLNTKFRTAPSTSNKYTIFKPAPTRLENVKLTSQKDNEVDYDGLGGTSKDDVFPSPKAVPGSLKRHKSSSSVSSSKFRKLAPTSQKNKVTDFITID